MAIEPRAEHFPHGADVGVRGIGRNRAEAFEQAAIALSQVIVDDPAMLRRNRSIHIECASCCLSHHERRATLFLRP